MFICGGVILELKDWMLLLIPIICNGVIIAILQKKLELRMNLKLLQANNKQASFVKVKGIIDMLQLSIHDAYTGVATVEKLNLVFRNLENTIKVLRTEKIIFSGLNTYYNDLLAISNDLGSLGELEGSDKKEHILNEKIKELDDYCVCIIKRIISELI
jgi:hypothetical protein